MKRFIPVILLVILCILTINAQSYNTTWIGSIFTSTKAFDVKVVGRLAYVVGWDEDFYGYYGSFSIIDVYFPSAPFIIYSNYINDAYGIDVVGDYAYIAESNRLLIYNISNPANPALIGQKALPGSAKDIKVIGSLAYIADGSSGLRIVDISNPSSPVEIGFFDSPGKSYDVEVRDTVAYLADYTEGFLCINISDPSNPTLLSQYTAGNAVIDIDIQDTLAFYTDGYDGIKVLDISEPDNLHIVGKLSIPYWCLGIKVAGDYAYVAAWAYGGLIIVDISDPSNMEEVGYYITPGYSRDVDVAGSLAYVADWNGGGLQIIRNDLLNPVLVEHEKEPPKSFQLEQNYPNPFNPVTSINYQLPVKSHVTLKVYNVLGKEVGILVDEEKEAGSYQLRFDGSNLAGGIYFYTLQTEKNCMTKKMILLK